MNNESLWVPYKERLLSNLKGTVFHLTSQFAFKTIQGSGGVENNKNERFKLNTNSKKSFGRLMGWVCLFDLRNSIPELITDTLDRYDFFLPPGDLGREASKGLAYLILHSKYYDRLIPYERYNEHVRDTGQYLMAVPKVETWIANIVPITWIEKVILARIDIRLTNEQLQARARRNQIMESVHRNFKWGSD